jgi:hypothetical protein
MLSRGLAHLRTITNGGCLPFALFRRVSTTDLYIYIHGLRYHPSHTRAPSRLQQAIKRKLVEAAGVEPASENVTGQETTCLFAFMPWALPQDVRGPRSERTRNASR